jgi:hypothetical protein
MVFEYKKKAASLHPPFIWQALKQSQGSEGLDSILSITEPAAQIGLWSHAN